MGARKLDALFLRSMLIGIKMMLALSTVLILISCSKKQEISKFEKKWNSLLTSCEARAMQGLFKEISFTSAEAMNYTFRSKSYHDFKISVELDFLCFLTDRLSSKKVTKFRLPGYRLLKEGEVALIIIEHDLGVNFDEIYDKKEGAIAEIIAQKSKYASPLFFSFGSKFKTEKNIIEMQTFLKNYLKQYE